ncbi:MAG: twin-arginine translocase subunit TatB [Desulfobacteraceae bacterium]|nr:MAG: twin-arginine translocase subunit TatB [Desulfobacteraceae bacterium]
MFGIGMPELILILAVALIVIGPKKLPDLAKSLGKAMGEFKRATNDLKQTIEQETGLGDVRESLRKTQRDLQRSFDAKDSAPAPPDDVKEAPEGEKEAPEGEKEAPEGVKEVPEGGGAAEQADADAAESSPADRKDEQGKPKENGSL